MLTVIIDNYDSYTLNIYQLVVAWYKARQPEYLKNIIVVRNDQMERFALGFEALVMF
jgi:anthranilate/para-aminobenzoate synthase component II